MGEIERKRECVREWVKLREKGSVCVSVYEIERERECVRECV